MVTIKKIHYSSHGYRKKDNQIKKKSTKINIKNTTRECLFHNRKFAIFNSEMMGETIRKQILHFGLDKKGSDEIPLCKITHEENDITADDLRAEYSRWHHRLGHKILVMIEILPRKIASIENSFFMLIMNLWSDEKSAMEKFQTKGRC